MNFNRAGANVARPSSRIYPLFGVLSNEFGRPEFRKGAGTRPRRGLQSHFAGRGDVMKRLDAGNRPTRRQALTTAATFMILPARLARGYASNEKLNLGIIGLAGMGGVDARTFSGLGENIAAL